VTGNIEFVVLAPGKAGSVRADRNQIEQVLINLVANARDAMPAGGKLTIEADQVKLEAGAVPEGLTAGDHVRIRVSDTGGGIRPETQPYVFEPFFTTKSTGRGAGLGLATCFGIVKQHQGHIAFESEQGKGTTFTVLLPLVEDAVDSTPHEPEEPVAGGRETILVVEDETLVRDMAVDALRARGYTVIAAQNGSHALQIAKQQFGPIHLLITDLVMPQVGGSELAGQLEKSRPGMRVLYTSGYTESFEVPKSLRAIGGTFLRKPYTPTILAAKVREVLD
jgi:CheY-like chemotaxis protein